MQSYIFSSPSSFVRYDPVQLGVTSEAYLMQGAFMVIFYLFNVSCFSFTHRLINCTNKFNLWRQVSASAIPEPKWEDAFFFPVSISR